MGQFSNSLPNYFSYLCEYAFRFDLSCSFCEYPIIFHCLHWSPSCFDPDSLLLAHFWLGLSWIDSISANKRFSSSKTSSRKPYTNSKQQEKQKHSAETTINFSLLRSCAQPGCMKRWRVPIPLSAAPKLLLTTCSTCWKRKQRGVSTMISTRRALATCCLFPSSVGQSNRSLQGILQRLTFAGC